MIRYLTIFLLSLSALAADSTIIGSAVLGSAVLNQSAGGGGGGQIGFVRALVGLGGSGGTSVGLTVPAGGVDAGSNVVVCVMKIEDVNHTGSSITDTRGNTYTSLSSIRWTNFSTYGRWEWLSAPVTTALQAGDTITVTYTAGVPYFIQAVCMTNVTAIDVTATNRVGFDTTLSIANTTTTANTYCLGAIMNFSGTSRTYGSGNWDAIGNYTVATAGDIYFVGHLESTTGSKDPAGSWNSATDIWGGWAALK